MSQTLRRSGLILAFFWTVFQLWAAMGPGLPDLILLPVHACFAIAIALALEPALIRKPGTPDDRGDRRGIADIVFTVLGILVALATGAYFVVNADPLSRRIPMVQTLDAFQVGIGIALVALVLEAARRTSGLGIVIVVLCFIAYAMFGHLLPPVFATTPVSLVDFIDQNVFTTQGIFGVPLSVSATYVFYFVLFAAFLEFSGGGRLFIDIALGLTRGARGGPAKAAVIGSGLMGMASGSAVANVVSTGVFTIPLMKAAGYKPKVAAAVEALASTGAQIMPPLMGAAAFIMANTLGVPYSEIVLAATLPALLYFTTVFIAVDFEARRRRIEPLAAEDSGESGESRLKRVHLLIPLIYLVVAVVSGRSLMLSALEAMALVVVVSWARKATRLFPPKLVEILAKGGARVVTVAVPCAAAGIVVGVVAQTGVGLRFSEFLVGMSGDNIYVALAVVMVGCLIMGMGLPTTAAYIMAASLFAPALTRLGIPPIGAHMFVFYFACLSMITPPVALASYAAASVAEASANATGWTAALIGIPLFLLPYAFVGDPALLGEGTLWEAAMHFVIVLVGIASIVGAICGHFLRRNLPFETVALGIAGAAIMIPFSVASWAGAVVFAAIAAIQLLRGRRPAPAPASSD